MLDIYVDQENNIKQSIEQGSACFLTGKGVRFCAGVISFYRLSPNKGANNFSPVSEGQKLGTYESFEA